MGIGHVFGKRPSPTPWWISTLGADGYTLLHRTAGRCPSLAHRVRPLDEPGHIVGDDVVFTGTITCDAGENFVVAVKDLRRWVDGTLIFHLWGKCARGECTDQPSAWTAVANHGCGDPTPGLSRLQMTFFLFEHSYGSNIRAGDNRSSPSPSRANTFAENGVPQCKHHGPGQGWGGGPTSTSLTASRAPEHVELSDQGFQDHGWVMCRADGAPSHHDRWPKRFKALARQQQASPVSVLPQSPSHLRSSAALTPWDPARG